MADVYASAVGTTVLQLKEIPRRPPDFNGALGLFGLASSADEATIRGALSRFGKISSCDLKDAAQHGHAVVRFTTHEAALSAKRAGAPATLCVAIDTLYNERSYNGRRGDDGGRDDDDGRGW